MKLTRYFAMAMAMAGVVTFSSCLDYDDPEDTFQSNEVKLDDNVFHGNVDSIDYKKEYTVEQINAAHDRMEHELGAFIGAQQLILGGKVNGQGGIESPSEHSYQAHATMADVYAQYSVIPHSKFDFGDEIRASYHVARGWNAGANGTFVMTKNNLTPVMNHPSIDTIPELKALALLFYNFAAVRNTDLYGPMPYQEFKVNKQHAPFKYDSQEFIYKRVVENINTFVACFKHLNNKSDAYKDRISDLLGSYTRTLNTQFTSNLTTEVDKLIRLANSLKLRMAMHIVKRDKDLAKQWAEEAVKDGVIEEHAHEFYLPATSMHTGKHPLAVIGGDAWKDFAPSASFVTLLKSLKHPYVDAPNGNEIILFSPNSGDIRSTDGTVTEMGKAIVGIRSGSKVGAFKGTDNPYISFSRYNDKMLNNAPIYLFKLSEVYFLRAEGALRGWNMGQGTAESFYNKGVEESALLESTDPLAETLKTKLAEYLELEAPVEVVYVDPTGKTPKETTRTKIGVKWNEGDSNELKLEKIITQKYIALFPNGFEAWGEMRRTGYPKLFPVLTRYNDGSLKPGDLVRRMIFPNDDQASINDIQATGLDALGGPDQQGTRLWWDVNTESNF